MISLMPKLYPDEILYSWFSRYHTLNGNLRYSYSMNELFGKDRVSTSIYYPMYLDFLCKQLPQEFKYTPEELINNHSIIPIFKPFMTKERYNKIVHNVSVGGANGLKLQIGINTGDIFETDDLIKICPKCFKEQIEIYGQAYIYREHQIPGISICRKHSIRLYNYIIPKQVLDSFFVDINTCDLKFSKVIYVNESILKHYKDLYKDIECILNGYIDDYSINEIHNKYLRRLTEKGYRFDNGNVNQNKLESDFIEHYSKKFLKEMESYIEPRKNRKSWIRLISTNSGRSIHPIRHILFIRFLFGDIIKFSSYKWLYSPFGEAPFPCLNVICKHYGKLVIDEYNVTKNKRTGNPVGNFRCKVCGFEYARVGPDKFKKDMFRIGMVKEHGHIWDNKLIELVDKKLSINKIMKEMGCCRTKIVRNAERLSIIDKLNTKQRFRKEITKKISDKELDEYRNTILKYIKSNPTATRQEIRAMLTKEWALLYLRDKQWIEKNVPKGFIKGKTFSKSSVDINWKQRDIEVFNIIKNEVLEVYNKNLNIRITRTYLSKFRRCSILSNNKNLNKLPLTRELLNEVLETKEQYKKRINSNKKIE
ncbi:hypothetical protein FDE99_05305 [Clostridium botulinum]|nr:hypothetical protein [Clostridium botulinum]